MRPGVGLYWPDFPQYETSYIVRLVGLYWLGTLRYLDQIPWRAQLRLQKGVDPTICQSTAHQRNTGHRLLRKLHNYFLHNVIEGKAPGYSTLRRSSENNPTNKTSRPPYDSLTHLNQGLNPGARPSTGDRDISRLSRLLSITKQPQNGDQALQQGLDPTLLLRKEKVTNKGMSKNITWKLMPSTSARWNILKFFSCLQRATSKRP